MANIGSGQPARGSETSCRELSQVKPSYPYFTSTPRIQNPHNVVLGPLSKARYNSSFQNLVKFSKICNLSYQPLTTIEWIVYFYFFYPCLARNLLGILSRLWVEHILIFMEKKNALPSFIITLFPFQIYGHFWLE